MHLHDETLVRDIARTAQQLRIDVLKMVYGAKSGHLGGPFSAAEIVASLYFHHLRIDPARPDWAERDRFILSKGHASPVLYAALARRGFFPVDELSTFRQLDSRLHGHPERIVPGVEVVAGPLGHGVAIGAGMALAARMGGSKPSAMSAPSGRASAFRVYALLGDGETNAGVIWEGVMTAAKYRLGNLVAIVDDNGIQQTGATADVMPMEPMIDKWRAFGLARPGNPWPQRQGDPRRPGPGGRHPRAAERDHRAHDQGSGRGIHGVRQPLARRTP